MAIATQIAAWGDRWPRAAMAPMSSNQSGVPPITFGSGTQLVITTEIQRCAGYDTDFEDGVIPPGFVGSWEISDVRTHGGQYSLKSGSIPDGGISEVVFHVPAQSQFLSFWYYVSTESGFDFFRVYSGTTQVLFASGETGWQQMFMDVSQTATVTFKYFKDSTGTSGDDAVYIDDVHIAEAWEDISSCVWYNDGLTVQRGIQNEQVSVSPSQAGLTLKDQDKRFAPRYILGPYFGWLGAYTKLRIGVDPGNGLSRRFTGSVPDWSPKIGESSNDRFTTITAVGALHQLQQGDSALESPLTGAIIRAPKVRGYWALEEESNSTEITSNFPGGTNAAFSGEVNFASDSSLIGSKPIIAMSATSSFIFGEPGIIYNHHWTWGSFIFIPEAGYVGDRIFARIFVSDSNVYSWFMHVNDVAGVGKITISAADINDVTIYTSTTYNLPRASAGSYTAKGVWNYIRFMVKDNGTTITWLMDFFPAHGGIGAFLSDTFAGTVGNFESVLMGALEGADLSGTSIGHIFIQDDYNDDPALLAGRGYGPDITIASTPSRHETAPQRFTRMNTYANLPRVVHETVPDGQIMGIQQSNTIEGNLTEVIDASEGIIYENEFDVVTLASHTYMHNREIALYLDYAHPVYGNQIFGLEPADDDLNPRNKWTITRQGGTTAVAELSEGRRSTQLPPDGIGVLDDSKTLNLGYDAQAGDHAWFRVYRDTVDKPRLKKLTIALHRNPELIEQFLKCDIGSRIYMVNPPGELGIDAVDQTIIGITERFNQFTWYVDLVTVPAIIFAQYDRQYRYDCRASNTGEYIDLTETAITLFIDDECYWAHDTGDFNIRIDQEEMTVTAAPAATGSINFWSQTLTVVRGANGITQTHREGTPVHLASPAVYAL
jgi:hypothetical protein